MSIRIMSNVWECASLRDQAQLLVMLALADFSNDQGECFPAVATLAEKARVSERHVQKVVAHLQQHGLVKVEKGAGKGRIEGQRSNLYRINLARLRSDEPIPAPDYREQNKKKAKGDPRHNDTPSLCHSDTGTPVTMPPLPVAYDQNTGGTMPPKPSVKELSKRTVNNASVAGVACAPDLEPQEVVVVSSLEGGSEEEPRRIEQLQAELAEAFGLEGHQIEMVQVYAKREGLWYVEEKAALTRLKAKDNPARYFELAMKRNWPLPVRLAKKRKSASQSLPPSPTG